MNKISKLKRPAPVRVQPVVMPKQFKLKEGEKLNRNPNQPIISAQHGYLWIGNDAPGDKMCFATLSGKKPC